MVPSGFLTLLYSLNLALIILFIISILTGRFRVGIVLLAPILVQAIIAGVLGLNPFLVIIRPVEWLISLFKAFKWP